MKKIIITVSILILCVGAVTWFYFKNISASEQGAEKVFQIIPADASLIFEFKNDVSFYDVFKEFSLFRDVLGNKNLDHLNALKNTFVDDASLNSNLAESNFFFSLHPGESGNAEILVVAPIEKNQADEKLTSLLEQLSAKYKMEKEQVQKDVLYMLSFNNESKFYFSFYHNAIIGSFDENIVKKVLENHDKKEVPKLNITELSNSRNRNAIAKLYISYPNLHQLLSNFSRKKNPDETAGLKLFPALSQLNINYQSNAFMFSGTSEIDDRRETYASLFLEQQPGKNTLANIIPYDAANYLFFYVSDQRQFSESLKRLLKSRKELDKREQQLDNITKKHSINIEKEFPLVLGNEFGTIQLASWEKLGLIKSKNISRLSFLLSAVSPDAGGNIRRFDDSNLLYYYLGDPFKAFRRPYFAIIENHVVVANTTNALRRFLKNYEGQDFLSRTEKSIMFQQYLSNQGNIFYFIHNSNAKSLIRSYLGPNTYKNYRSDDFDWKNMYGLSVQFSADKDRFFTNLFMSKIPEKEEINFQKDSLGLDTLLGGD